MGATMCAMYCGLDRRGEQTPVRNLALLTMPIDGRCSVYAKWTGNEQFDPDYTAELWQSLPGWAVDFANRLLKPVTNFWTTDRKLWEAVQEGRVNREAQQSMAKWVGDNPPFPGKAFAQWLHWLYRDDALIGGRISLRGRRVELGLIDQNLLIVTAAGGSHRAPGGNDADLRPRRERGRHPLRPSRRPHRPDRRIEGARTRSGPTSPRGWRRGRTASGNRKSRGEQRDEPSDHRNAAARHRVVPRRSSPLTPAGPGRVRHRRHARHRRRDLRELRRAGRDRGRRLRPRQRARRRAARPSSRTTASTRASIRATSARPRTAAGRSRR